jgi:putative membrane-bound dehydrogenase-like protein
MRNAKRKMKNAKSQLGCLILQFTLSIVHFVFACSLLAVEAPKVRSPLSPRESLEHLVLPDGLQVDLAACEPNVIDPVAIRFDENGRMWVVEMRDYPNNKVTGPDTRSRLSVLDDRDGDGFYETAAVVTDDLRFATGIQPWNGGVFVTMAGRVIYLKDTNGDDKPDINEVWYAGFSEENQQLRANHPRLSLDNHIYIANGLRGGEIVDARQPDAKPLSISGMDFRFDPFTRRCEAVSGVGQFGLTFDDYNNRFICSNRNPAMHVVLEDWHLKKNPLVAVPAVSTDVAKAGEQSRLFPIGKPWTTSNLHAGQFTAACGLEIYRGDALPSAYYADIFVCDPTAHVVHREVKKPKGATFTSFAVGRGREFLASPDQWFSPVNLETGPDGALYVVDMYRAVIEHPEWMPIELRERPDLLHGNDLGRVYRIVPEGFRRPPMPRLADLTNDDLVDMLADPNAWKRETAARLLLERQEKTAKRQLRQVALQNDSRLARIHALWLLNGLQLLDDDVLLSVLDDDDARVVEQATILAESRLAKSDQLRNKVAMLISHPDARVRFQALMAALPMPTPPVYPADEWEQAAMLVAAGERAGEVVESLLQSPDQLQKNIPKPVQFIAQLARLAGASNDPAQQHLAVKALVGNENYARAGLASLFAAVANRSSLDAMLAADSDTHIRILKLVEESATIASDTKHSETTRCESVDLLSFFDDGATTLGPIALDDPSQAVRLRAIAALAKRGQIGAWHQLIDGYSNETPSVQRGILAAALTNADGSRLMLEAVVAGRIKPTEVDLNNARLLLQKLFADAVPQDREKALRDYQAVLTMTADSARGRAIFQKHCAVCHKIDGIGTDVAPDISDSRERLPQQLLADIIQPNRAIDSNYFSYTVTTSDGLPQTGILTAETSTSITLKQQEGKLLTIPRSEIEELRSDGISFMPDGLEKNIPPQEMADLIAFIKNWRYLKDEPTGGQ